MALIMNQFADSAIFSHQLVADQYKTRLQSSFFEYKLIIYPIENRA